MIEVMFHNKTICKISAILVIFLKYLENLCFGYEKAIKGLKFVLLICRVKRRPTSKMNAFVTIYIFIYLVYTYNYIFYMHIFCQ